MAGPHLRTWTRLWRHHDMKHHPAPHQQSHRSPAFGIRWKMALFHLLALSTKVLPDAARSLWSLHFIFLYLQRKVAALGRNYR